MDYQSLNLEELIRKSKDYDRIEKELDEYKKQNKKYYQILEETKRFFEKLIDEKINFWELNSNYLNDIFKKINNKEFQGALLAKERLKNIEEYNEQIKTLEEEYEYKLEELTVAWEKFRIIRKAKHQKVIKEINAEKI